MMRKCESITCRWVYRSRSLFFSSCWGLGWWTSFCCSSSLRTFHCVTMVSYFVGSKLVPPAMLCCLTWSCIRELFNFGWWWLHSTDTAATPIMRHLVNRPPGRTKPRRYSSLSPIATVAQCNAGAAVSVLGHRVVAVAVGQRIKSSPWPLSSLTAKALYGSWSGKFGSIPGDGTKSHVVTADQQEVRATGAAGFLEAPPDGTHLCASASAGERNKRMRKLAFAHSVRRKCFPLKQALTSISQSVAAPGSFRHPRKYVNEAEASSERRHNAFTFIHVGIPKCPWFFFFS